MRTREQIESCVDEQMARRGDPAHMRIINLIAEVFIDAMLDEGISKETAANVLRRSADHWDVMKREHRDQYED